MLKRFLPFSFLMLLANIIFAQRPVFVPVDMSVIPDASRVACDNMAGTSIQTLSSSAQSNDKKYLCYNDKLTIKHNKDQVLISDPLPATQAGVGYLYLTCAPTKSGVTIQDIASDPCILKTPTGGTPTGGFYIETGGNLKGDNEFQNDGFWQTTYGSGKPYRLFFAPITFDKLDIAVNPPKATYEGSPAGACVHVNNSAAFEVIYLNEIKSNIVSQGNLAGSFKNLGGLPEYDSNASNYSIDISLKTNNSIKGNITSGAAKHNSTVLFSVPQNGTYTVNVEDGKSCGNTFDMIISSVVDVLVQNDTVCAGAKGMLSIIPSGGTGPYTYTWEKSPKGSGPIAGPFPLPNIGTTINDLDIGSYSITVQDTGTGTDSPVQSGEIITSNELLSVTLSQTNPSCPDRFDGNVSTNVIGGYGPYYYEWSNGEKGSNKANITGVGVVNGNTNYSVTVTDRFGCKTTASTNLTINQITIGNVNSNDASCYGAKDGQLFFSVTGGTPIGGNYKFRWQYNNNPNDTLVYVAGGANFFQKDPGLYSVTITDALGCNLIKNDLEIKAARTLLITKNIVDVKCYGASDASFSVQVTQIGNGSTSTGPVFFVWTPTPSVIPPKGTAFTTSYEQVSAGLYKFIVKDSFKCVVPDSIVVKQPSAPLDVSISSQTDPTCAGNSANGKIVVNAFGGTPSYKYAWNKNPSNLPSISNLYADTYVVTVTDGNGCTKTLSITLTAPPGPQIASVQTNNVNCFSDSNGSIKVTATGAAPGDVLTYKWSNGGNTAEILNLTPKGYTVTVTDQKGCAIKLDTAVLSPLPLELVGLPAVTKPSCPNSNDGKIEITVKGGTPVYTYNWKSDAAIGSSTSAGTTFTITDLVVGAYDITVTDQNNCPSVIVPQVTMSVPPVISITKTVDKNVDCFLFGTCDGQATVTVTAGNSATGQYNFLWSTGSIGSGQINDPISANNLCRGWNTVTITDGKCELVDSVFIDSPPQLTYDTTTLAIKPVTCFGGADGGISVEGYGGTGPYTYNWGHGPTTSSVTNLNAGDYLLTITDSKNCPFSTTITVTEPLELIASVDTSKTDSVSCARYADGKITIKFSGGNPGGYAFEWSPNVSTREVAENLPAGSYSVIVSDAKGCTTSVPPFIISEPDSVSFTLDTVKTPLCFGYLTEVKIKDAFGGSGSMLGNYTYSIDDGAPVNAKDAILSTIAGIHNIKVFDPNGCFSQQNIRIDQPPQIRVYLGQDVELELGNSFEINATIDGFTPITKYNWSWSPNATPVTQSDSCKNRCAQIIRPLVDGSYILLVEDTIGCFGSDTLNITIDRNRNVFFPNIFSPNVDGTNDFFEVYADPQSVEQITSLKVFDRWGNNVFSSPAFIPSASRLNGNRWNGYFRDIEANIGVYVYSCEIKFIDGVIIVYRGDVMLAR